MDDSEYFFFKKFLGRSLLKVFFYLIHNLHVPSHHLFLYLNRFHC